MVNILITGFFSYFNLKMTQKNNMKLAQILFVFTNVVYAYQGPIPPPPAPPPPPGLPIDGTVVFVFALALLYGVIKHLGFIKSKPKN